MKLYQLIVKLCGIVLETINNKPVTDMYSAFVNCGNVKRFEEGFKIHKTVKDVGDMFAWSSITEIPENLRLEEGIEDLSGMFAATYVTTLPTGFTIPNSVKSLSWMFTDSLIESLPSTFIIHEGIEDISYMFHCSNISGIIVINSNNLEYEGCFVDTEQPIVLTGTSDLLEEIAATATNGNVTVDRSLVQ